MRVNVLLALFAIQAIVQCGLVSAATSGTSEKPVPTLISATPVVDAPAEGPDSSLPAQPSSCPPAPINSVDPPLGSLLYLSVRGKGNVVFQCTGGVVDTELPVGEIAVGTGVAETDVWNGTVTYGSAGAPPEFVLTTKTEAGKTVTSTLTALAPGDKVPAPDGANTSVPWQRWQKDDQSGADATAGGLPDIGYINMVDTKIGDVPTKCSGSQTKPIPFEATYNFYTCQAGYVGFPPPSLIPIPAPVPAAFPPPVPRPIPVPAPAPVVPKPAPVVAPTPIIVVPPVPSPAAPSSAMKAGGVALAVAFAALAA